MKLSILKKTKIAAVVMAAALVLSGCSGANEVETTSQNEPAVTEQVEEASVTEEENVDVSEDNTEVSDNAESQETSEEVVEEATEEEAEDTSDESSEDVPLASSVAESGTPVGNHGELSVNGTQLVDKNGNPYQLQGVSTHGITWFPEYVNRDSFKTMRDEWGVNCVRLAMYTEEYNGYCSDGNKTDLKNIVNNGVSYATDLGMYVIIDWHILHDNDPTTHKSEAIAFFDEMSAKYADYDNVLYEICNEPNGGTSWSTIKAYAEEVIPVIKANNPNAIIIVGTPTWSQDVDQAAANPITGYTNIMYTLHFYADTHRDDLRNKLKNALNAGLPIMVTEFGITDASGNGNVNTAEGDKWIELLNSKGVSYCIWNLSNKDESSSLLISSCQKTSGWTTDDLSAEGKWYLGVLGGTATGTVAPSSDSSDNSSSGDSSNNNSGSSVAGAVTASSSNAQVSLVQSGGWDGDNGKNYQYTVTIKNTGSGTISGWSITVDFGQNVSLDQSWNGNYSASGSKVTITPVDFNKTITAGGSQEVGFIVSSSFAISNPTVTIN